MATVADVIRVAESQIGYVESGGPDGRSGNLTKYWAELDPTFQGQPWCAAFQRWVDKHAGGPLLPVTDPYYCPNLVTYARHHSLWDTSGHYPSGAYVFFDWTGSGVAEHVERVIADDGVTITTVGGNTSPDQLGSQANGGGVYQRHRPHGTTVLGALDYNRLLASSPPAPVGKVNPYPLPHRELYLTVGRYMNGDDVRFVQWAVGCPVDGVFGPQTNAAVRVFQHYHALTVDGVVGPLTLAQLVKVRH